MEYIKFEDRIDVREFYWPRIKDAKISGDEVSGRCPFHDDQNASFSANLKSGFSHCHAGCGSWNIATFHAKVSGVDTKTAVEDLCRQHNIKIGGNGDQPHALAPKSAPPAAAAPAQEKKVQDDLFIPENVVEKEPKLPPEWVEYYQRERGWSPEIIDRYVRQAAFLRAKNGKIYAVKDIDSVVIIVWDAAGIARNFRIYCTHPRENQSKMRSWGRGYGGTRLFPAVPEPEGIIYILEGEPDTLKALSDGLNAITFTSHPTTFSPDLIEPFSGRNIVIVPDCDKPGEDFALKVASNLAAVAKSIKIVIWPHERMGGLPDGSWPDNHGLDYTDYRVKHKKSVEDFLALPLKDYDPTEAERGAKKVSAAAEKKIVDELNEKHAVVMVGGKCCVMNEDVDPISRHHDISLSSVSDFRNRYANREVEVEVISNGKTKTETEKAADVWFYSDKRRQYEGIVFMPGSKETPGSYNLWKGFAVEPRRGDWSIFNNFIFDVICNSIQELYLYTMAWIARLVQDPGGDRPGTAIVMRGKQGTGKGTLANLLGALFGPHYIAISQSNQVTGRFNSHLKDKSLAFVDEGFWAGSKEAEGVLKAMITEPYVNLEQKGKDVIRLRNHVNILIASNNQWVVPAGLEERRFLVLDVSDRHQQDHPYFKAIHDQMKSGGLEAMLYDLLEYDRSVVNLRQIPRTCGLLEQIISSMSQVRKFWFQKLKDGSLTQGEDGSWPEWVTSDDLYREYLYFSETHHERYPFIKTQFFIELRKICHGISKDRRRIGGGVRSSGWRMPDLEECRNEFDGLVKMPVDWDDCHDEAPDPVPF